MKSKVCKSVMPMPSSPPSRLANTPAAWPPAGGALAARGLDALLIFAQESQYYLFGYDGGGYVFFQCTVLTTDAGPSTLLCRRPDVAQARDTSTIEEIRVWLNAEDADPAAVLQQLNALRGALAQAEARKEAVTNELADLQGELQRAMLEQEILRETRGGDEPPPEPPITKGVAVVDPMTYDAMLPEEQAELQIFGFKMSFATTTKK